MASNRQLAAIMFTDIVGYTALMEDDEQAAFELLRRNKLIQRPIIETFNGTWLKEIGDGALASFNSVTEAIYAAATIQKTCENQSDLNLRIGIHQGEVIFDGKDVFGSGVNIASRLESLAEPGNILVSEAVNKNLYNKKNIKSEFLGSKVLKGVKEPVNVYHVKVEGIDLVSKTSETKWKRTTDRLALYKKVLFSAIGTALILFAAYFFTTKTNEKQGHDLIPDQSVAIIPFKNLSSEEGTKYFSDGMMYAIHSHLSKFGNLRVISPITMEHYRSSPISVPTIAKELHVSHILEGSVQRYGDTVSIIVQLIDATNDMQLWSEIYTRELKQVFNLQSEIARQIAGSLQAQLSPQVSKILSIEPTQSQQAYDFYLKGEDYLYRSRKQEDYEYAIQMYKRAIDTDPSFTLAWVGLAKASRLLHHFHISPKHQMLAKDYLDKANALNPDMMEVLVETGKYYYHCELNYQKALEILEKLKLEYPNNDDLFMTIGHIYRRMGQYQKALDHQNKAISLSPFDWTHWASRSYTLIVLARYLEAETNSKKVIELNPSLDQSYADLARLYLIVGDTSNIKALLTNGQNIAPIIVSHFEMICKNYNEAVEVIESSTDEVVANQYLFLPKSLQLGLIYYTMSSNKLAESHFLKSVEILKENMNEYTEDSRIYSSLGIAYAGLGMTEESVSAGNKALSIMNISIDALRGFQRELDMAKILLIIGDYDKLIPKLEFLIQQNGYLSVELLKIDPFWDPLRKIKAFQELIKNPKYQIKNLHH